jgi:hypothetical protein
MSKLGLRFFIDEAEVSVEEMGDYVASHVFHFDSERLQELCGRHISYAIFTCVGRKVYENRVATIRDGWIMRHPPNHAGYYYCHLCGGWVHYTQSELDHIEPRSVRNGLDPGRDDNLRMSHAWQVVDNQGKIICPGNRGKGSSRVESATLEIRPPDWEL